jgi:hypothetical protein
LRDRAIASIRGVRMAHVAELEAREFGGHDVEDVRRASGLLRREQDRKDERRQEDAAGIRRSLAAPAASQGIDGQRRAPCPR